jgi:hypothetical protein
LSRNSRKIIIEVWWVLDWPVADLCPRIARTSRSIDCQWHSSAQSRKI